MPQLIPAHSLAVLRTFLLEHRPYDLLVAGSRGGALAAALCREKAYTGRALLLASCERVEIARACHTVTVVHGTADVTYPFFMVAEEAAAHANIQLLPYPGADHELAPLDSVAEMRRVIQRALVFEGRDATQVDAQAVERMQAKSALFAAIAKRRDGK